MRGAAFVLLLAVGCTSGGIDHQMEVRATSPTTTVTPVAVATGTVVTTTTVPSPPPVTTTTTVADDEPCRPVKAYDDTGQVRGESCAPQPGDSPHCEPVVYEEGGVVRGEVCEGGGQ